MCDLIKTPPIISLFFFHTRTCSSHPSIPTWPHFKFINKTSELADTAITPSKNKFQRQRIQRVGVYLRVCLCECSSRSSAVSHAAERSEESVWTTAECFGSPTVSWKAVQSLYLLQISQCCLPSTFSYPRPKPASAQCGRTLGGFRETREVTRREQWGEMKKSKTINLRITGNFYP